MPQTSTYRLDDRRHRRRSSCRRAVVLLLQFAAVLQFAASVGSVAGCRVPNGHVRSTRPGGCAECHVEIAFQWQSSPHATAWTSAAFQSATDQAAATECLPCHAPEPLLERPFSYGPQLRSAHRQDGVDCHACHADCGGYAGRHQTFGPHGMVQDTARLPCSEFCGTCHVTEMEEYAAEYGPAHDGAELASCADCHMPRSRARLTQGHLLSLIHPKRAVPDHSFSVWNERITDGAVEVAALRIEPVDTRLLVHVTLVNRRAGHRIPTGKFGHREVRILAEAEGSDGQILDRAEQSLVARTARALLPQKPADFVLAIPLSDGSPPRRVRLTVERVNEDRSFRYPLAVAEASVP